MRLPNSGDYTDKDDVIVNIINKESTAMKVLPAEDAAIFNGELFKAEIKFQLAAAGTKYLCFTTPSVESKKIVIWGTDIVKSDINNTDYRLLESTQYTDGGVQPVINVNRLSPNASLSSLSNAPTGVNISSAVEIDGDCVLGSQQTGPQTTAAGGSAPGLRFMILKPATKYCLEIKNNGNTTANIYVKSSFIETII